MIKKYIHNIIKKIKIKPIISFLYALTFALMSLTSAFSGYDNMLCDMLYQREAVLDGSIIVLGIDERALEALGPFQTWDRNIMAEIIDAINQNPDTLPAAIGVDMMYYGNTTIEDDTALSNAAGRYGNVVVGTSVNFKQTITELEDGSYALKSLAVDSIEQPYAELRVVTKQGHLNTIPDEDGYVRKSLHQINSGYGRVLNSFAYEIYRMYAQKNDIPVDISPPVNSLNQWYIPYSAKPGGFNDNFSVIDVLNGTLPPEMFENAIVLIGPYATGMRDSYTTPIDRYVPMNGVEIHANIIQALINGNFPYKISVYYQSAIIFLLLWGLFWAFRRLTPRLGAVVFILSIAAFFAIAYILGINGIMIQIMYIPIGISLLYFGWIAVHYASEIIERHRVTDMFKKYVAPQVVDEIMQTNHNELNLGGAKKDIACMFVDIRGFTTMSENLPPEDVVEILNESLALTSNAILAHNGTLDKFIGDATMAIFNAPLPQEDYIYQAVLTAWDIIQGSSQLNTILQERIGHCVKFGIGLHCGSAVVGNIGTSMRMDYTAIGDTVNTASRLEGFAKPGQVLISEDVYNAVKDRIEAVNLGTISLKGKANGVVVYSLRQINEYSSFSKPLETIEIKIL